MELTFYTDYALRVLIYAGLCRGRLCLISEIAEHYGISRNHLTKVVHGLARGGFVQTHRGKSGGLALARPPQEISLGEVVRYMEGPFRPVECFRTGNLCVVTGPCSLPKILEDAFHAFIDVLSTHTLADLLHHRGQLAKLLFPPSSSRRTEMA